MRFYLQIIILFSGFLVFPQGEANIWYFGDGAGLDFNTDPPTALSDSPIYTLEGCATISDSSGQLLFYTDGRKVYNKFHQIMSNGEGLLGHTSSTQSAIIVPNPGNPDIYYVFTVSANFDEQNGVNYSEVNMTLNGGNGDVTAVKNINLISGVVSEKLTAVRHANGSDYWVLCHQSDSYYAFLVTSSGVSSTPIVNNIGINVNVGPEGYMKFSPDGTRLIALHLAYGVDLLDFDANTGQLSNYQPLVFPEIYNYGVEFSPSGNIIYISSFELINPPYEKFIYLRQYDLLAPDIADSATELYNYYINSFGEAQGALQVAPDGKIYHVYNNDADNYNYYVSVIEQPEVLGTGCNFISEAISVAPATVFLGLPQFIQSYFVAGIKAENLCLGDITLFTIDSNSTVVSVLWDFGDGTTSTLLNPSHIYTNTGTYTVTAEIDNGSEVITKTKEITISEVPFATEPDDIFECDNNNDGIYSFDLTQNTNAILNGQSALQFGVRYYANSMDYTNNIIISNPENYQNNTPYQTQTIVAEVYNLNNSKCKAVTNFDIRVFDSPQTISAIAPVHRCDDDSFGTDTDGKVEFNLTENEVFILDGQSSFNFSVEYYTDSSFNDLISDSEAYVNTSPAETIYVKVFNPQNPDCFVTASFEIEVFSLPVVNDTIILKQCDDDDNDGFSAFNLTEAETLLTNNNVTTDLTLTYFETSQDAFLNSNPITDIFTYTNQQVSNDQVFVRVENTNNCFRVVLLELAVVTTQIPDTIHETFIVCDDMASGSNTDGIATFDFSSIHNQIVAQYPSGQLLDITYYRNLQDALAEQNAITDIANYTNTDYPFTQNIYIRVDSQISNECLGLGHHITLVVEPVPIVQPLEFIGCDNTQNGQFGFDTSTLESELLNGLTDVSVQYWDADNNLLPDPLPNPFVTSTQTITARVINNSQTGCYYETTVTFTVSDLPQAFSLPTNLIKACDDEQIPGQQDGLFAFDTSDFQDIILGNQTGMIVNYYDEYGVTLQSPLPNPFVTHTQNVLVEVINSLNTNCITTLTIPFEVYPSPVIEPSGSEIVCSNDPSFTKVIDAGLYNENQIGNYTYTWFFNGDIIPNQTNYNFVVNAEGIYTVEVKNSNGCISVRTITVSASDIAAIEEIQITDLSNNNSIVVLVSGLGDYRYSLDGIMYQESNIFTELDPGLYTVYIKDMNGCGVVSENVSLLGIPNFFTPNGDGVNDIWNIKGILNYSNSKIIIYVYDRYGKLLAQTNPREGWDGTYYGHLLPSTDYWYVVELENGRVVKGHFSLKR